MHRNADHVRDKRLYPSLNHVEFMQLRQAMHARGMSEDAAALRQFAIERAEQVLAQSPSEITNHSTPSPSSIAAAFVPHLCRTYQVGSLKTEPVAVGA